MDILKFDEKRCFCDEEDVFVKDKEIPLDGFQVRLNPRMSRSADILVSLVHWFFSKDEIDERRYTYDSCQNR